MKTQVKPSGIFIERPDLIYIRDNFEDIPSLKPEKIILRLSKADTYFDVGALCYRKTKAQHLSVIKLVDENSIDLTRREAVSNLVDFFKAKDSSAGDKNSLYAIRKFQFWMDSQSSWVNFEDKDSLKQIYIEYTAHLINRKNLPKSDTNKGKSLTNNSASQLQKRARIWCHCITQVPIAEIEFWAPRILHNDRFGSIPDANPFTLDDCNKSMSALCQIIDDTWIGLVKEKQDYFRVGNEWVDLTEKHGSEQILLSRLTSFAALSFIAVTGANKEVACKLEVSKGNYSTTTKGMKFSGLKARANNKKVFLEFGAKYLKYWKKYLDLRDLVLDGEPSKYAFPYRTQNNVIRSLPPVRLDYSNQNFPSRYFEKITGERWIRASKWRPSRELRINLINNGDVIQTAEMQSHTFGVALKHYLKGDLATAAAEISGALNAVYEAAIRRTRSQESIIVDIVEKYNKNRVIPTGQCSSEERLAPQLASGFTDQNPVPDCLAKETCIFCEYYGVHADGDDLRRLLSLRFLCEELKESMGHDEYVQQWGPVIFRVDEIISAVLKVSPDLEAKYESIRGEVNMGYLDKFWALRLETLMAVGVIS